MSTNPDQRGGTVMPEELKRRVTSTAALAFSGSAREQAPAERPWILTPAERERLKGIIHEGAVEAGKRFSDAERISRAVLRGADEEILRARRVLRMRPPSPVQRRVAAKAIAQLEKALRAVSRSSDRLPRAARVPIYLAWIPHLPRAGSSVEMLSAFSSLMDRLASASEKAGGGLRARRKRANERDRVSRQRHADSVKLFLVLGLESAWTDGGLPLVAGHRDRSPFSRFVRAACEIAGMGSATTYVREIVRRRRKSSLLP